MTIRYHIATKPSKKGVAKLPVSMVASTIVALKARGFTITSVK